MDDESRFYMRLYLRDFPIFLFLAYAIEIIALFILEFAPFSYFSWQSVLYFLLLFPVLFAAVATIVLYLRYERILARVDIGRTKGVERR